MTVPPATNWAGPVMVSGNTHALCIPCRLEYPAEGPVTDADRWAAHHARTVHPDVPEQPTLEQQETLW